MPFYAFSFSLDLSPSHGSVPCSHPSLPWILLNPPPPLSSTTHSFVPTYLCTAVLLPPFLPLPAFTTRSSLPCNLLLLFLYLALLPVPFLPATFAVLPFAVPLCLCMRRFLILGSALCHLCCLSGSRSLVLLLLLYFTVLLCSTCCLACGHCSILSCSSFSYYRCTPLCCCTLTVLPAYGSWLCCCTRCPFYMTFRHKTTYCYTTACKTNSGFLPLVLTITLLPTSCGSSHLYMYACAIGSQLYHSYIVISQPSLHLSYSLLVPSFCLDLPSASLDPHSPVALPPPSSLYHSLTQFS